MQTASELITPLPDDVPATIRAVKRQLRTQLGDPRAVYEVAAAAIGDEVAAVVAERTDSGSAVPVVEYATSPPGPSQRSGSRRSAGVAVPSCAARSSVAKPRSGTASWSRYLDRNDFMASYRGPADELFSALSSGRPQIYGVYWSRPQIAGPPARADGHRPPFPQLVLGARVRRTAVVRPRPRHRLPRPHPAPPAEHAIARPVATRRLRFDRTMAAPCLPARLPPRLLRRLGALRPVGRRPPRRDPRVPDDRDVLGVPDVPGLDGPVGDAPRRRRAPRHPDPSGDGPGSAAGAAGRHRRRRPMRRRQRPRPGRRRAVPRRCCCPPTARSRPSSRATPCGGTATSSTASATAATTSGGAT